MRCPVCGGKVATDLRVDIDANVLVSGEHVIRLSNHQAVIVHILAQGGAWVTMEQIIKGNYGASPPVSAEQIMRVTISQLRKILRPIGWDILGQYRLGYCLIPREQ